MLIPAVYVLHFTQLSNFWARQWFPYDRVKYGHFPSSKFVGEMDRLLEIIKGKRVVARTINWFLALSVL